MFQQKPNSLSIFVHACACCFNHSWMKLCIVILVIRAKDGEGEDKSGQMNKQSNKKLIPLNNILKLYRPTFLTTG
jgi:hypothetical protein